MRSWRKYGGKSGKIGKQPFGILGHERAGPSLCPPGNYTPGHHLVQELRGSCVVGYVRRDRKRSCQAVAYETTRLQRVGPGRQIGRCSWRRMVGRPAVGRVASTINVAGESIRIASGGRAAVGGGFEMVWKPTPRPGLCDC